MTEFHDIVDGLSQQATFAASEARCAALPGQTIEAANRLFEFIRAALCDFDAAAVQRGLIITALAITAQQTRDEESFELVRQMLVGDLSDPVATRAMLLRDIS